MRFRALFAVLVVVGVAVGLCVYRVNFGRPGISFTTSAHVANISPSQSRRLQGEGNEKGFISDSLPFSLGVNDHDSPQPPNQADSDQSPSRYNASEFTAFYEPFHASRQFFAECATCAVVSSSGTMLNSSAGKEIDDKECVIRMNNAPTLGYERDVGARTTYRVFAHSSAYDVKKMLQATNAAEVERTFFVVWGPERNMKNGGPTNLLLRSLVRIYPEMEISTFKRSTIERADRIFEEETGRNRLKSGTYLSTGWFTMLFVKNLCRSISVYGMIEDGHCDRVQKNLVPDVNYHYYDEASVGQCVAYVHHENAPAGAHRFITEKRVFKKWAKEWGHVQFFHPRWSLQEG